jgi:hypothetical protein
VLDPHAGLLGRLRDAIAAGGEPAILAALEQDADDVARMRAQRFQDRVDAVDEAGQWITRPGQRG